MFVWAPIPEPWAQMGSINFAMKLLDEAGVAVSPGRGFGEDGEGYLRMAIVENSNRLRQAVREIGRCTRVEAAQSSCDSNLDSLENIFARPKRNEWRPAVGRRSLFRRVPADSVESEFLQRLGRDLSVVPKDHDAQRGGISG